MGEWSILTIKNHPILPFPTKHQQVKETFEHLAGKFQDFLYATCLPRGPYTWLMQRWNSHAQPLWNNRGEELSEKTRDSCHFLPAYRLFWAMVVWISEQTMSSIRAATRDRFLRCNALVDRSLCSEFQLLSKICEEIDEFFPWCSGWLRNPAPVENGG
jgi:hypothetical protein